MYRWRRMTPQQRAEVRQERLAHGAPPHSVPHARSDATTYYMITAACYQHARVIGHSSARMCEFESALIFALHESCQQVFAWTVLPNHYHVLVNSRDIAGTLYALGRLHGRHSFQWNGEDDSRGRQVWCNAAETAMKSEGHYYASLNYILHNAIHHGYVEKWTDWPYCNAEEYIAALGRERALKIWRSYPLYEYGKTWDPVDL
jgi:putative transposase